MYIYIYILKKEDIRYWASTSIPNSEVGSELVNSIAEDELGQCWEHPRCLSEIFVEICLENMSRHVEEFVWKYGTPNSQMHCLIVFYHHFLTLRSYFVDSSFSDTATNGGSLTDPPALQPTCQSWSILLPKYDIYPRYWDHS